MFQRLRSAMASSGAIQTESTDSTAVVTPAMAVRRERDEEMRIETLRHHFGRDPMREMHEMIAGEPQIFRLDQIAQAHLAFFERLAVGVEQRKAVFVDEFAGLPVAREQDARFFESFADCGRRQRAHFRRPGGRAVHVIAENGIEIAFGGFAAGKDQRAGGEIDLVMAFHHEDFETVGAVADKQNRGCRDRRCGRLGLCVGHVPSLFEDRLASVRRRRQAAASQLLVYSIFVRSVAIL